MTPNDAQIDVLLRRHAGQTKHNPATEHLDADELNAFAEGSLPAAARSRYVSHLADCDDCRKVASQLAITSGALVAAEAATVADSPGYSWWKRLSGFFSPLTLRYAAFAVVLVAVVGVTLLVLRRPREASFVAQNEPASQPKVSAVKPAEPAGLQAGRDHNAQADDKRSESASPAAATPMVRKADESKVAESSAAPPPKPEQETSKAASPALVAENEPKPLPSYAPPPPGEITRSGTVTSERRPLAGEVASGPRKSESPSDKFKMMDRSRAADKPRESQTKDDGLRAGVSQPQASVQKEADEKAAPGRDAEIQSSRDRNAKESRARVPATQNKVLSRAPAEEAPETRSVGGRKFRRQGNAWVDAKFKSSMTLKSISRGSSEFDALDSGLRSIAEQISGEVIVVWKNKAYLIR